MKGQFLVLTRSSVFDPTLLRASTKCAGSIPTFRRGPAGGGTGEGVGSVWQRVAVAQFGG